MITSTSNPKAKHLLQLQKKGRVRREEGVFIAEGYRMFQETPRDRIAEVYVSEAFRQKEGERLEMDGLRLEVLADHVFSYTAGTMTPQGILCVVKMREYSPEEVIGGEKPHVLVLDNLQDPGNVGTILRTAEGAGVTGIILSRDCVDIYNPKVIRSTMGSIYRVPFAYADDLEAAMKQLKGRGIRTFAAHLEGQHSYECEDYTEGTAFLLGNEGNGLRREIAELADCRIQIPMQGEVESLNVAIAASVLMFEAARQRRRK